MSYVRAYEKMAGLFSDAFGGNTGLPIAWGNAPFTPPSPPSPWVRFNVLPGEALYASAGSPGNNVIRHSGIIAVQVFVPAGEGDMVGNELADEIIPIFQGKRLDDIYFGAGYISVLGAAISPGWYQVNVNIPFRRDEIEGG